MAKAQLNLEEDTRVAMLDKLALSGLDHADAKRLGFKPCVNGTAEALGMQFPGFKIPYFDVGGKEIEFFRYRFLTSTRKGLDALTNKKDQKYAQPPKTGVEAYFPPFLPWQKIAKDIKIPIIYTEGELKAACACKLGIPTIGLGGVWSFKSANQGVNFLPSLEGFEWEGRHVYICYDSDAGTNPQVMQAQNALAKKLVSMKARAFVISMRPGPSGEKVGLDDFLVANGVTAFKELMAHTEEWGESAELHQLNEEVVYVKDPGLIYRLSNGQKMNPNAFTQHAYSNRLLHIEKQVPTKGGKMRTTITTVPLAQEWLKWEGRAEVERLTYQPGKPRITLGRELNTWPGWGVEEPRQGSVMPWQKLTRYLFRDAGPEALKWFEQWCAYPFVYPGTKMFSAVVLWSRVHGVGKSLVGLTLGRLYGKNFAEIKDDDLHSSFNDYAECKQFVVGEEITGGDKRGIADRVKGMLTQTQLRINTKFVPRYVVPDCVNYMFFSNHPDSFFIEDTDRRYFIVEVKGEPLDSLWYRNVYDPWYKSDEGARALFYYFQNNVDLSGFDPRMHAPMTMAKAEMISDGRSDVGLWVSTFFAEGMAGHKRRLWTAEELLMLYDPMGRTNVTVNGMGREMKRCGAVRPLGVTPIIDSTTGKQIRPWLLHGLGELNPSQIKRATIQKIWDMEHKLNEPKKKKFVAP